MYSEVPLEVVSLAQEIVAQYMPHLEDCRIGFVFRETAQTSGGKVIWGKCGKVPDKLRPYMTEELDILVELAEDVWTTELREEQKRALIHHELLHIIPAKKEGFTTRGHDFEEFIDILKIYGLWRSDLMMAGSAMKEATAQLPLPFESASKENAGKVVAVRLASFMPDDVTDDVDSE